MDTIKSLLLASPLDRVDAKILLHYICQRHLGWTREQLISSNEVDLPQELIDDWLNIQDLRLQGHPVAYLTQSKSFYDIDLFVNDQVLIPRPDTELLVEHAIDFVNQAFKTNQFSKDRHFRMMDMGTGSGAIILSITHYFKDKQLDHLIDFVATDISHHALEVARLNASRLNINQIQWIQSDWFEALSDQGSFDVILSNPPYIAKDDRHLLEGDLRFEPQIALTDHQDGLLAYRTLANQCQSFLHPGGTLMVEHGYLQKESIHHIFRQNGLHSIETLKDLARLDRVTVAQIS